MVGIEPFQVELWMDAHETEAKYNLAETCAASISLADLATLSKTPTPPPPAATLLIDPTNKLTYGAIRGSPELRTNIAALYSSTPNTSTPPVSGEHHILTTPGAIAANFLVCYTILRPGDHVIVHYPTYAQLYQVPRSLGAEVSLWRADPAQGWALDVAELRSLIRRDGKTRLLVLNNPNNPTGSVIPTRVLEQVVELAREKGMVVLCDEVYRPLFHSLEPREHPPSALNVLPSYPDVIVTGSLSKSFSLAGIRVGWIASRSALLIDRIASARHFTAISVSMLDEMVAARALSQPCAGAVLERNMALARTNLGVLEGFVEGQGGKCGWVRPVAGTTALIQLQRRDDAGLLDDVLFCERLLKRTGVLLVPGGKCFSDPTPSRRDEDGVQGKGPDGTGDDMGKEEEPEERRTQTGDFAGSVRVGYVCETEVLREALVQWSRFMKEDFENVPIARGGGGMEGVA